MFIAITPTTKHPTMEISIDDHRKREETDTFSVIPTKHNLRHRARTDNIPFYHSLDRQPIPMQYDARFKLGPFVGDPSGYENTRTGLTGCG